MIHGRNHRFGCAPRISLLHHLHQYGRYALVRRSYRDAVELVRFQISKDAFSRADQEGKGDSPAFPSSVPAVVNIPISQCRYVAH